jgi:uncharacterized protein YggU (UPF0235/DUF167 family)
MVVKATPRAGRDGICGIVLDAAGAVWLVVKVTAPPDGGRANDAVLRLLARVLGVPVGACRLAAGVASRWKRVRVLGETGELAARAAAIAGQPDWHY